MKRFPTLLAAPFAALIYVDAAYTGIRVFTSAPLRRLLADAMPAAEGIIVALALAVGGMLALVGMLADNPRVERGGLALLAAGIGIYGITVLAVGSLALVRAWLDVLLAVAAVVRFWRLGVGARLRVAARG